MEIPSAEYVNMLITAYYRALYRENPSYDRLTIDRMITLFQKRIHLDYPSIERMKTKDYNFRIAWKGVQAEAAEKRLLDRKGFPKNDGGLGLAKNSVAAAHAMSRAIQSAEKRWSRHRELNGHIDKEQVDSAPVDIGDFRESFSDFEGI